MVGYQLAFSAGNLSEAQRLYDNGTGFYYAYLGTLGLSAGLAVNMADPAHPLRPLRRPPGLGARGSEVKGFGARLRELFGRPARDEQFFEELADILLEADLGPAATDRLLEELREQVRANEPGPGQLPGRPQGPAGRLPALPRRWSCAPARPTSSWSWG